MLIFGVDMLLDQEAQRLFSELVKYDYTQIKLSGEIVSVRIFDNGGKILLSTTVYTGNRFIPNSVRQCVSQRLQIGEGSIRTFLKIDEKEFKIWLHFLGVTSVLDCVKFKNLLEEFNWIAEEWREILEEHGKRDLIHVPRN